MKSVTHQIQWFSRHCLHQPMVLEIRLQCSQNQLLMSIVKYYKNYSFFGSKPQKLIDIVNRIMMMSSYLQKINEGIIIFLDQIKLNQTWQTRQFKNLISLLFHHQFVCFATRQGPTYLYSLAHFRLQSVQNKSVLASMSTSSNSPIVLYRIQIKIYLDYQTT